MLVFEDFCDPISTNEIYENIEKKGSFKELEKLMIIRRLKIFVC